MNPLICIPSIRDIIEVKRLWHQQPYDLFIVKYKPHHIAYKEIKEFFLEHTEYTHIVITSDDLEVKPEQLQKLLDTLEDNNLQTVSGYCNVDETYPNVYALQPKGIDYSGLGPRTGSGAWYSKNGEGRNKLILPDHKGLEEFGFSGFACQVITRELFEKVTLIGENEEYRGNFDYTFYREITELGIPVMVDLSVKMWHRRTEHFDRVKDWKDNKSMLDIGYNVWIQQR